MGALLSYSVQSGLLLLAMYLAYKVFLASANQHAFNRGVILCIYAVSFIAMPLADAVRDLNNVGGQGHEQVLAIMAQTSVESGQSPLWCRVALWIYMAGMLAVASLTVVTWLKIFRIIKSGKRIRKDGCALILTENKDVAPFSWMKYMVMNTEDYEAASDAIYVHELRHISCRHWIDLLVAQIVVMINWYNPAAWLMREELMLVHEYQADMAVAESGCSLKDYQFLLMKKAVGARFPSLANSLNHSKLKKRFTMMYKSKSSSVERFKAIALVPAVALAFAVATVPQVRGAVAAIGNSEIVDSKGSEKISDVVYSVGDFTVKNVTCRDGKAYVTILASIPGQSLSIGDASLRCGSESHSASSLETNMVNGLATIIACFKDVAEKDLQGAMLSFVANREHVSMTLKGADKDGASILTLDDKVEIYIGGKKADKAELSDLSPDDIESITITRTPSTINVTLKK